MECLPVSASIHVCLHVWVLNIVNIVKTIKQIFTKLTALDHFGTDMDAFRCWGQKVKVQGHGGIKCAGNSCVRVETSPVEFRVAQSMLFNHVVIVNINISFITPPPIHREWGIVFDRFLCLCVYMFLCLFVCFCVSKITRKWLDRFA